MHIWVLENKTISILINSIKQFLLLIIPKKVHMLNDEISEEKILKYFGQQEIIMYPPIIGCHIKNKNSIE